MKGANNIYAIAYGFKLNGNIKDILVITLAHFLNQSVQGSFVLRQVFDDAHQAVVGVYRSLGPQTVRLAFHGFFVDFITVQRAIP